MYYYVLLKSMFSSSSMANVLEMLDDDAGRDSFEKVILVSET